MSIGYLRFLVVVPVLVVAGCSSMFKEPPGITYAKNVEQLGITAVYPPREDMQVGDIYAIEAHSFSKRMGAKSAFIATKDMRRQVAEHLASRYKFNDSTIVAATTTVAAATTGSTTTVSGTAGETAARQAKDAFGTGTLPTMSDGMTLPINGFPSIEVNSGITIGVGGQPKGLAASFGFSAAKTLKMSLQFGQVTSYEVPISVGMDAFGAYCKYEDPEICTNHALSTYINQKYQLGANDPGYVKSAGALMVTKVYLARQIVYTFNDATLAAAAAAVVGADGAKGSAPVISAETINNVIATNNPNMIAAMSQLIATVNTSVATGASKEGAVSIATVTATSVSIREVFTRPVVIGYEGVSMPGN